MTGLTIFLLVSLNISGTGINLLVASNVYVLEPWWNHIVEDQAISLVHRIGQEEQVKIWRFVAKNSIEEEILESHEKKRNFAEEAFRRASSKEAFRRAGFKEESFRKDRIQG
ncbi:P-loop containing nucleoside triphosphate hydrolase [Trema orientale]|uniref:P-loop containing nucleoside triphosphate hydrolase n=1 Tax=Trema orientale TaxID=63057 RepID=A0A2P5FRN9_TREOI|nr:P-loop containing nucleoside triphosphate hydrolase [Trema orientale]